MMPYAGHRKKMGNCDIFAYQTLINVLNFAVPYTYGIISGRFVMYGPEKCMLFKRTLTKGINFLIARTE